MSHKAVSLETFYPWEAKEWPIKEATTGDSLEITGTVISKTEFTVRRSAESQRFLQNNISTNIAVKMTQIILQFTSGLDFKTRKEVSWEKVKEQLTVFVNKTSGAKASEAITLVLPPPPKEQVANPSAVLPHLPSTRERAEIAAEKEKNTFKGPFLAIWAPSTAEAELKARPDATAEPLSQHTILKVVTQGSSPLSLSIEVVKPGAVRKAGTTVKKENVNVEAGMRDFIAKYEASRAKVETTKPADNDDDDW